MLQIRRNVFETNSSSSHSVSVCSNKLVPSQLTIVDDDWKYDFKKTILVDLVGFCGGGDHTSQNDKLAYLILQIAYILNLKESCIGYSSCYEEELETLYATEEFKELEAEICEYAGAELLRINPDNGGYIDHESVCDSMEELKLRDLNSGYTTFVFSENSYVYFEFNG